VDRYGIRFHRKAGASCAEDVAVEGRTGGSMLVRKGDRHVLQLVRATIRCFYRLWAYAGESTLQLVYADLVPVNIGAGEVHANLACEEKFESDIENRIFHDLRPL